MDLTVTNGRRAMQFPVCLLHESAEEYHAKSRDYLSSHGLAAFRKSPHLFYLLVNDQYERKDSSVFVFGRAAHVLILEGEEAFSSQFTVGGPINPRTGEPYWPSSKAFKDYQAMTGKTILTSEQANDLYRMARSVREHPEAAVLLRREEGTPEAVVRAEYREIPSQIRMDWFSRTLGIVDLKTCEDLSYFEVDARKYEYIHQLTFYREVLAVATGSREACWLVAVEKKQPNRCGVWRVSDDALDAARDENEAAIRRMHQCARDEFWPTGFEEVRVLSPI